MQTSSTPNDSMTSVDPREVERFSALSEDWWNPDGPMKALHWINPQRIGWLRDRIVDHFPAQSESEAPSRNLPLRGYAILDVGCGAGLLSEPLRRLGGRVTGIDASAAAIEAARAHAASAGLDIAYRCASAEELVEAGETFDVVLALEIIEHVASPREFMRLCVALTRPGGLVCASTLNRTFKSYALAIVGAEFVLRWVPRGTHDWEKFVKPRELSDMLVQSGCAIAAQTGLVFNPLKREWRLSRDMDVNYMIAASKPSA